MQPSFERVACSFLEANTSAKFFLDINRACGMFHYAEISVKFCSEDERPFDDFVVPLGPEICKILTRNELKEGTSLVVFDGGRLYNLVKGEGEIELLYKCGDTNDELKLSLKSFERIGNVLKLMDAFIRNDEPLADTIASVIRLEYGFVPPMNSFYEKTGMKIDKLGMCPLTMTIGRKNRELLDQLLFE